MSLHPHFLRARYEAVDATVCAHLDAEFAPALRAARQVVKGVAPRRGRGGAGSAPARG